MQKHFIICAVFLLLLTIIIYGLGKSVVRMAFSSNKESELPNNAIKLSWTMYAPQVIMLILAFIIGIYMPLGLSQAVLMAVAGF